MKKQVKNVTKKKRKSDISNTDIFDMKDENTYVFQNNNKVMQNLINTPIKSFIDYNVKKSELFINDNTYQTMKNLFSNIYNQPLLINGLPQIGKGLAIFHMLQYLPYFNIDIEPKYKYNDIRFFNTYDHDEYQKILCYQNCYYIDMKLFLLSENNLPIKFLLKKSGNYKSLDGNSKIVIIKNINLLNNNNQRQLANIIERYQHNHLFIMTTSRLSNIVDKIISLSLNIKYAFLNKENFTKVFKNNFNHLIKKKDDTIIEGLYLIYEQNNYNISRTLHQIYYLFEDNKIDKKFFKNKINYISLQTFIISNIINKFCTQNKISVLEELRKSLYLLNSLNINLLSIVKDTIQLLLVSKISDKKKSLIIDLGSNYSIDINNADREIIHFENFFLKITQIITMDDT